MEPTVVAVLLAVGQTPSGKPHSHGVTGGVYKTRERIHRGMLSAITSDSDFMQSSCRLQSGLRSVFWD
ncbi:hypothetical protein KGMB02707_21570 [Mesosutterella multiformis]|nr:hypothetical protein KGMB02707_21570 [Mesosutterella multiformis]